MNKNDSKEYMRKYLNPFLESNGFIEKKIRNTDFTYIRTNPQSKDYVSGGFNDYNPSFYLIYGTGKQHNSIISILKKLSENVTLNPPFNKDSRTIIVSYENINQIFDKGRYLPEMKTEADVEICVNMMIDFMQNTAFPLLDKFEDVREIDSMINGEIPWVSDWQMPFIIGSNFLLNRLIIAKLAGNKNYNDLINYNYTESEKKAASDGYVFTYDRIDLTKPLPALIKLLEDVKPLY